MLTVNCGEMLGECVLIGASMTGEFDDATTTFQFMMGGKAGRTMYCQSA